jgi:putative methionine-R-sulfoxide reductase with GAF domain
MKLKFSFTFKILLPFVLLMALFFLIILESRGKEQPGLLGLSITGMVLSFLFGMIHIRWLNRPMKRVSQLVALLTRGILPEFKAIEKADEIGELERNLEEHVSNLKHMAAFSRSLASGDFKDEYEGLSNQDELGLALNKLKISLMESSRESEARRSEEENRTWAAQGLAKFSSLFREAEDNMDELSAQLMKELVEYTEADAGALFITRSDSGEGEFVLEQSGTYAFDRAKEAHHSFKFGEGLVGRAALEKELILISDLPADYIKIRSGLGEDTPSSVLLVPVVLDQQVLGVMELASLGNIPAYQVEFVNHLADALSTTLSKVRANMQSTELFEQTRKHAEELASQERVFKENMVQLEQAYELSLAREQALQKEIEKLRKGSG